MLHRLEGGERLAVLILQLFLGFIFAMHGAQKLFGPAFYGFPWEGYVAYFNKLGITPAGFWVWVVTVTEFFGGISICCGFLTRFWAAGLVIDMTVAILKNHIKIGFFWLTPGGGLEFPLTLGVMALVVFLLGPSYLSVDRAIGLERRTA
jgi:putative oxidoreductase